MIKDILKLVGFVVLMTAAFAFAEVHGAEPPIDHVVGVIIVGDTNGPQVLEFVGDNGNVAIVGVTECVADQLCSEEFNKQVELHHVRAIKIKAAI